MLRQFFRALKRRQQRDLLGACLSLLIGTASMGACIPALHLEAEPKWKSTSYRVCASLCRHVCKLRALLTATGSVRAARSFVQVSA
jgi:hypothetical protein